jgi:hypothetical protein
MQNFYHITPNLILNQRLRAVFLLRNVYLMVVIIFKTYNQFLFNNQFQTNYDLLYRLNLVFFSRGFGSVLKTTGKRWKSFMTTAITKSIQHHIYTTGLSFIEKKIIKPTAKSVQISEKALLFNQYVLPVTISNISLHNKPARNVMFRLLILILSNWSQWNRHYNLTLKFLIGSGDLQILYFYNMFLFKIYHL